MTVPGVPGAITQTRHLDQVPPDAAEVIEIQTGRPMDPASLTISRLSHLNCGDLPGSLGQFREV